jgi:hypothetical protein
MGTEEVLGLTVGEDGGEIDVARQVRREDVDELPRISITHVPVPIALGVVAHALGHQVHVEHVIEMGRTGIVAGVHGSFSFGGRLHQRESDGVTDAGRARCFAQNVAGS